MRKKMYWGITTLILLIGVVGVYFMLQPEPEPEKKIIVQSEADHKQASDTNQPPREPRNGFEWEWHNDHWHEVSIVQTKIPTSIDPITDVSKPNKGEKPTNENTLTYDEELFNTNPVEALRREMKARGHWATKYLPPFPLADLEAQEFAKYEYLITYMNIVDGKELSEIVHKKHALWSHLDHKYGKFSARAYDISRITWVTHDSPQDISLGFEILVNSYPSEYFPIEETSNNTKPKSLD